MPSKYCTYLYLDPEKPGTFVYGDHIFGYEPFYVGKGTKRRPYALYKSSRSRFTASKLKSLERKELKPLIVVLDMPDEKTALRTEIELIGLMGRRIVGEGPLTNISEGGEKNWLSGLSMPKSMREKIRKAHKGRVWSKEQLEANVQQLKAKPRAKYHIVTFPSGNKTLIYNLAKFCRIMNLTAEGMMCARYQGHSHRGYRLESTHKREINESPKWLKRSNL